MNIIQRIKKIIFEPSSEWEKIREEKTSVSDLFTKYVMILAAVPPVCTLIGANLFGVSRMVNPLSVSSKSLAVAVVTYIASVAGVFVLGLIIDAVAPSFSGQKDSLRSFKIAAYAPTAAWVSGILNIIPSLSVLSSLFGLYSIYLLYSGLKKLKEAPKDKTLPYFFVILAVSFMISGLIAFFITTIMLSGFSVGGYRGY
jgi:hypothetical protein